MCNVSLFIRIACLERNGMVCRGISQQHVPPRDLRYFHQNLWINVTERRIVRRRPTEPNRSTTTTQSETWPAELRSGIPTTTTTSLFVGCKFQTRSLLIYVEHTHKYTYIRIFTEERHPVICCVLFCSLGYLR